MAWDFVRELLSIHEAQTKDEASFSDYSPELAVTMVLLVPLILYTLFLEDLLAYRLENQEPTITAPILRPVTDRPCVRRTCARSTCTVAHRWGR